VRLLFVFEEFNDSKPEKESLAGVLAFDWGLMLAVVLARLPDG